VEEREVTMEKSREMESLIVVWKSREPYEHSFKCKVPEPFSHRHHAYHRGQESETVSKPQRNEVLKNSEV
jgi:hypothetical protein